MVTLWWRHRRMLSSNELTHGRWYIKLITLLYVYSPRQADLQRQGASEIFVVSDAVPYSSIRSSVKISCTPSDLYLLMKKDNKNNIIIEDVWTFYDIKSSLYLSSFNLVLSWYSEDWHEVYGHTGFLRFYAVFCVFYLYSPLTYCSGEF